MHKLALVVATKDRPEDLRKMLSSVRDQTVRPDQVVIVDASTESVPMVVQSFPELHVAYQRHWPPSAAAQRNAGLAAVDTSMTLIGFMDDDITMEAGAVEAMLAFWHAASDRVGGAAFNCLNSEPPRMAWLKNGRAASSIGLYSEKIGGVAASGWQSVTGEVSKTMRVRWLPSTASVWRRDVFEQHAFDEYFNGYSYLEDLEFSYSVGKQRDLYVVAEAGFRHYPSKGGRISQFDFGKIEVRNRLYFVRKHRLSIARCYTGLAIRLLMTLGAAMAHLNRAHIQRAAGNFVQLITPTSIVCDKRHRPDSSTTV
ncbi:MAG: glycosyltransferase [Rhodopirellula sp.]|nr:glycosyltransferase [Rhodopirellula sp.]